MTETGNPFAETTEDGAEAPINAGLFIFSAEYRGGAVGGGGVLWGAIPTPPPPKGRGLSNGDDETKDDNADDDEGDVDNAPK